MNSMSGGADETGVPGVVRLMTTAPIELPMAAAAGQDSIAEQLEERPWILAVAVLAALGLLLALRRNGPL